MKLMTRSPFLSAFAVGFCSLLVLSLLEISPMKAQAQAPAPSGSPAGSPTSQATTDPSEVRALNSMFQKWGISPSAAARNGWNITGEPCSGRAINSSSFDSQDYNPGIACDCSANSNSTCHITKLKVYALNAVGTIPEELRTLAFLKNVNLNQNYLTGPLPSFIGNLTRMQYFTVGGNALSGELPRELGDLKDLIVLSFNSNNFSGSLPPELGKLVKLEEL